MLSKDVIVVAVKLDIILLNIGEEFISSKHLCNLNQLVIVVFSLEERLLLKNHACKHTSQRPDIQRIVINLQIDQEFRPFEVPTRHSDIILLSHVVVLSQTPINKSQLAISMVNHDVVGFHIPMHDAFRVAEVKRFQHFVHVVADIEISECFVKSAEVLITCVHELHNQSGCLCHWVSHHIE